MPTITVTVGGVELYNSSSLTRNVDDDDWARPLQSALDDAINWRWSRRRVGFGLIELVFEEGEYHFRDTLRIHESYITIRGDSVDTTTIVHYPKYDDPSTHGDPDYPGKEFIPFLFQHLYNNNEEVYLNTGLPEISGVHIRDLTVKFYEAGGQSLAGVVFARCRDFSCRNVNIIGIERVKIYDVHDQLVRLSELSNNEPMYGSHTNGIDATNYSSWGTIENCVVQGMSAPGIYVSQASHVDVIDCESYGNVPVLVEDDYHGTSGFRVSNSEYINLIRCHGQFNSGPGLQISHNASHKLGSWRYPGNITNIVRALNTFTFEVFPASGIGFPSIHEAKRLGVENLITHRIEKIPFDMVENVVVESIGSPRPLGRRFTVTLSEELPHHLFPPDVDLFDIKLHLSLISNDEIKFDRCIANNNEDQGIDIGSEQQGSVGSNITFTRVQCHDNGACGIRITSAEDVYISRSDCTRNHNDGIYLYDCAQTYGGRDVSSEGEPHGEPIYWNLTRRIGIEDCTIGNNLNSGINILGVNNVTIDRITITTDILRETDFPEGTDLPESYHSRGCIHVAPLTFLTGTSMDNPHTKRIEELNINNVDFAGEAIGVYSFINNLIVRSFPDPPTLETPETPNYSRWDAEGGRIASNINAVISGHYELSFAGDPEGHIYAPLMSTFTDTPTNRGWWKSTEENNNYGWLPPNFVPIKYDPSIWPQNDRWWVPPIPTLPPIEWTPPRPGDWRPFSPQERRWGMSPVTESLSPKVVGESPSFMSEKQIEKEPDTIGFPSFAENPQNVDIKKGTEVIRFENHRILDSEKSDLVHADGLGRFEIDASASRLRGEASQENFIKPDKAVRMSQPQKPEKQNRASVEYLDKQKEVKIEIFAPKAASEVVSLGEQRPPVSKQFGKQFDKQHKTIIELLSPTVISEKR